MKRVLVIFSVFATIIVNGLANALPINGQTTGEISNRFDVLFTPANYVFAIWGLIYIGLLAVAAYQALPSQRDNPRLARVRVWLALSGVANIAWILFWHYEQFPLTLAAMGTLLILLIVVYRGLEIGRASVPRAERWLVQLPIGIYLGWISVATIANASVLLVLNDWGGWGVAPEIWTLIMMGIALLLGAAIARQRSEIAFPLVLVWAFVGIAVRNAGTGLVSSGAWVAAGAALLIALFAPRIRLPLSATAARIELSENSR